MKKRTGVKGKKERDVKGMIFMLFLGTVALTGGLYAFYMGFQFERNSMTTTAKITKREKGAMRPWLTLVFWDGEKNLVTTSKMVDGKSPLSVGQEVEIQYLPSDPKKVTLSGGISGIWFEGWFMTIFGLLALWGARKC